MDANVQCFSGWHMALALLAIATLLVCLISTVAVIVISYKVRYTLRIAGKVL